MRKAKGAKLKQKMANFAVWNILELTKPQLNCISGIFFIFLKPNTEICTEIPTS